MKKSMLKLFLFTLSFHTMAQAIWTRGYVVEAPRENIYQLPDEEFHTKVMEGRKHALVYPVDVSELMVPHEPITKFFNSPANDPVRRILFELTKIVSPFKSMKDVYTWLGIHDYPKVPQPETPNAFPVLTPKEMSVPMGATIMHTERGDGLTFGCAACHTSDLFGVKVLGLTNRFPRANEFFREGSRALPYVNSFLFKKLLQTTEDERIMFSNTKAVIKFVGTKKPVQLGLDTSLAQVALSLARRERDPYAEKTDASRRHPRHNKLETMVADSKPAVWWNVKYKNRWLSDGSIVSGNPIHTNFLWNEIGRGADLHKLEQWMLDSQDKIEALTAAVFATQAPRYEKFFGDHAIDIAKAQRGQKHYTQSCQRCHGAYEKGWESGAAVSDVEKIQTVRVVYHKETPVRDVGTDSGRYLGMKEFASDLNRLAISKTMGTVVEPQKGYVPPPLVGIWARWPYLHNNSVPNLCALLTPAAMRPKTYWAGAAIDKQIDFDSECVGYPLGNKTPEKWKIDKEYFFDTTQEGLGNGGHDDKIFIKNGKEIYTQTEKLELIEFLKTL